MCEYLHSFNKKMVVHVGIYEFVLTICVVAASEYKCPKMCYCKASEASTYCQNNQLQSLPEDIYLEVFKLDLSYNAFTAIPWNIARLTVLEQLSMAHNQITFLNVSSLTGLTNLKLLDLSHNKFTDWRDINRDFLLAAPALLHLDLSHNSLKGFPDLVEYFLHSNSLRKLQLVNCSITNVFGDILTRMPYVDELVMSHNNLSALNTQINSKNLRILDLSVCNLHRIHADAFSEITSLEKLILSRNYQLKKFNCKSLSLRYLDLSHCNLESVPSNILLNLTHAYFQGNHFRILPSHGFSVTPALQMLDLSNNSIGVVDPNAFYGLNLINSIDLSFNTISHLHPNTFANNFKLTKLDLSRNYLNAVPNFEIESLKWLDISVCEIQHIQKNSLILMPQLEELNLSRNLISRLPDVMHGEKLNSLDLSLCRIVTINNATFSEMGNLRKLNLAGNRLTSGIKPTFFYKVVEIQLDDNSWLCDCETSGLKELQEWLVSIKQHTALRCMSPENVAGVVWEVACYDAWYTSPQPTNKRAWLYSSTVVLFMIIMLCIVCSIKRAYRMKELRAQEAHEIEREEARERLRRMRQQQHTSRETVNRNAPDPRELQRPPCYEEAVLLPRLDGSYASLTGSRNSLASSRHSLASNSRPRGSNSDISGRTKKRRRKRRRRPSQSKPDSASDGQRISRQNTEDSTSEGEHAEEQKRKSNVTESDL